MTSSVIYYSTDACKNEMYLLITVKYRFRQNTWFCYLQDKEDVESWVELPDSDLDAGVLPVQIRKLVERRREVSREASSIIHYS